MEMFSKAKGFITSRFESKLETQIKILDDIQSKIEKINSNQPINTDVNFDWFGYQMDTINAMRQYQPMTDEFKARITRVQKLVCDAQYNYDKKKYQELPIKTYYKALIVKHTIDTTTYLQNINKYNSYERITDYHGGHTGRANNLLPPITSYTAIYKFITPTDKISIDANEFQRLPDALKTVLTNENILDCLNKDSTANLRNKTQEETVPGYVEFILTQYKTVDIAQLKKGDKYYIKSSQGGCWIDEFGTFDGPLENSSPVFSFCSECDKENNNVLIHKDDITYTFISESNPKYYTLSKLSEYTFFKLPSTSEGGGRRTRRRKTRRPKTRQRKSMSNRKAKKSYRRR
jgi:hypothetical protein